MATQTADKTRITKTDMLGNKKHEDTTGHNIRKTTSSGTDTGTTRYWLAQLHVRTSVEEMGHTTTQGISEDTIATHWITMGLGSNPETMGYIMGYVDVPEQRPSQREQDRRVFRP